MVNAFSEWNIVDLHIHSKESNKVKMNDYEGEDYSACELLSKLSEYSQGHGMLFSITDHDCINEKLYKELAIEIQKPEYKDKLNYIIGVELDVIDTAVYSKRFHCLVFFSMNNLTTIISSINELFDGVEIRERDKDCNLPNISKIFKVFQRNKIKDIILIPHYNRKSQGISVECISDELLNCLCFNAYEDANNITNITESLKIYLKAGYDELPFVAFSDNHDLNIYPKGHHTDTIEHHKCFMLSNLEFPFYSIKTAFEEPRLRISIDGVSEMRSIHNKAQYIQYIQSGDNRIYLSPYQNTIIGKFGSGKSLLLERIKGGEGEIEKSEKYKQFYNSKGFQIYCANNPYLSVNEMKSALLSGIKIYYSEQIEDYYYRSELDKKSAIDLFKKYNISFTPVEDTSFDFHKDELIKAFNEFKTQCSEESDISNLNYELAFIKHDYYKINSLINPLKYKDTLGKISKSMDTAKELLENEIDTEISYFTHEEIKQIQDFINLLKKRHEQIDKLKSIKVESSLSSKFSVYYSTFIKNDNLGILTNFRNNLNSFLESLEKLSNQTSVFERAYNKSVYDTLMKSGKTNIDNHYSIESFRKANEIEYKPIVEFLFPEKDGYRKSKLLTSLIAALENGIPENGFSQKQSFEKRIDKYCADRNNEFKSDNVYYDILLNEVSMLKKSAGEKSSLFINLLFSLIEKDLKEKTSVILMLDQPEDNIDNQNIYTQITNELKRLKILYKGFQIIVVTHNANVGISADSENIIIAQENLSKGGTKTFSYRSGCIENVEFIQDVCNTLEGGKTAMIQRSTKYGINVLKKIGEKYEL